MDGPPPPPVKVVDDVFFFTDRPPAPPIGPRFRFLSAERTRVKEGSGGRVRICVLRGCELRGLLLCIYCWLLLLLLCDFVVMMLGGFGFAFCFLLFAFCTVRVGTWM
jgi:hypothetical protein